jgi:hypothetical protein
MLPTHLLREAENKMEWNFGLSNPGQSAYGSLRVTSKLICKYPDHGPSV